MIKLLVDTSVLVPAARRQRHQLPPDLHAALLDPAALVYVSVVSLWEIAIKHRLGKLPLPITLSDLPRVVARGGFIVLDLTADHALAQAEPVPATRDPFDRLLLAVCAVEITRLLTTDRALAAHPLAWRAGT